MKNLLATAVLTVLFAATPSFTAMAATPPAATAPQGAASRMVQDSAGRVLASLDSRRAEALLDWRAEVPLQQGVAELLAAFAPAPE